MAGRQTPATRAADKAGITYTLHEYDHDPRAASFAGEAAEALNLDPRRVFKTLVVALGGPDELAVAIVPAAGQLDLKAVGKRAALADTARAEKVTGYVAGGISPLGQRKRLPTFLDASAREFPTVFVSAGRRGLEIELAPADLAALTSADVRPLARAG
ncbi:MAG TPA: Cys-tRNA(Pro) deacylase [Baekduia sp.]|nr:Cys-tRNA(Pro) deacylase [Baekduia sp.]